MFKSAVCPYEGMDLAKICISNNYGLLAEPSVSNIHSLLWESVPVYKSSGHKAKFVNVGTGMKRECNVLCAYV